MAVKLSAADLAICNANYAKNCGGCPLRSVCIGNPGPGQEVLGRWKTRINERAAELQSWPIKRSKEGSGIEHSFTFNMVWRKR